MQSGLTAPRRIHAPYLVTSSEQRRYFRFVRKIQKYEVYVLINKQVRTTDNSGLRCSLGSRFGLQHHTPKMLRSGRKVFCRVCSVRQSRGLDLCDYGYVSNSFYDTQKACTPGCSAWGKCLRWIWCACSNQRGSCAGVWYTWHACLKPARELCLLHCSLPGTRKF